MSDDKEQSEPMAEWIDRLVEIDETLQTGAIEAGVEISSQDADAMQLLLDLKVMHASEQPAAPPRRQHGVPEYVGRYEVRKMLGAGGFAVVYLAYDPQLHRDVAVKIPLPPGLMNEDTRNRFVQEARLTAQLDHPHIVPAYEAGQDGPVPFIAYAYCAGPTLAGWLQERGPMEPGLAAELMICLADAIEYSHQQGILHRDLKPANVLLFPVTQHSRSDFPFIPRLSDFGLAKLMESAKSDTRSSVILGTPIYMAPEQIGSTRTTPSAATDVYGLGAILYEVLTGRAPFSGETVIQVLEAIRNGTVERLRQVNSEIPKDLATICEKALSAVPEDRYVSAAEFRNDLTRFRNGEKIKGRSVGRLSEGLRSLTSQRRVGDASGFIVLSFMAINVWMVLWPLGGVVGLSLSADIPILEMFGYTVPLLINGSLGAILGLQVGKGKQWAAAVVMLMGGMLCMIALAVLAQWMPPFYPSVYSDHRTREIVYLLLFCLFGTQTFLATCAFLALRRRNRI